MCFLKKKRLFAGARNRICFAYTEHMFLEKNALRASRGQRRKRRSGCAQAVAILCAHRMYVFRKKCAPAAAAQGRLRPCSRGLDGPGGSGRAHLRPGIFISGVFWAQKFPVTGNRAQNTPESQFWKLV